jgi:predicted nucleic acid-binding protein
VRFVIDASIAVKWVLPEHDSGAATALQRHELLAPSHWIIEAANALWSRARRGDLTPAEVARRVAALERTPVIAVDARRHLAAAVGLANELAHPVYDCLYLAVARAEGALLVTADRRLVTASAKSPSLAGLVRLLGDVSDPTSPLSR